MSDKVGKLEEEARKRKEKLAALKNSAQERSEDEDGKADSTTSLPKPVFRSYAPHDEGLKENKLPHFDPTALKVPEPEVKEATVIQDVDLSNLAPKKVDWDLKRNISKKLDKLERRTQKAIAELIRERLRNEAAKEDQ